MSASDDSSDEEDSPNKFPYPTYPSFDASGVLPGGTPQGSRSFPLYVLFNPDGSIKPNFGPLTKDRRPIVVLPATMMNKPSRLPVDSPCATINGVPVYPDRFYQVNHGGKTVVVPGRYFRPRQSSPGTFSVKVDGTRVKFMGSMNLIEVSFNYTGGQGGVGAGMPSGPGLLAIPASGAMPRGYAAVCNIGGQQVTIPRKHMRVSNTRSGQMVVKYGNQTHLIASNALMMQPCTQSSY